MPIEGVRKVLIMGAYSPEVIEGLKWRENILFPILKKAIKKQESRLKQDNSPSFNYGR